MYLGADGLPIHNPNSTVGVNYSSPQQEYAKRDKMCIRDRLPPCSGKLSSETKDTILSFQSGAVSGKLDLKKGILFDYMINGKDVYKRQEFIPLTGRPNWVVTTNLG